MKIAAIKTWTEEIGLLRPYRIASSGRVDSVSIIIVEISLENGSSGLGSAAPTGNGEDETHQRCQDVLQPDSLQWLIGMSIDTLDAIIIELEQTLANTPAARAGIDIALHDALAKCRQQPLVELLGQYHKRLPTSVTIGIKSLEESLEEIFYSPPRPEVTNEARMYGGCWDEPSTGVWRLTWSRSAIEDFYLNNILIHELGHLLDDRNSSYTDRERYAEWFAIRYGYQTSGGRAARRPQVRRRHHRK